MAIREGKSQKAFPTAQIILGSVIVLIGMSGYQILKNLLMPDITPWQSGAITIAFTTLLGTVAIVVGIGKYRSGYEKYRILHATLLSELEQRKLAEEALKESQSALGSIIEDSPVPMAIIDRDLRIEYLNRKFIDVFGYGLEDIPTVEEWWSLAYPDEKYRSAVRKGWLTRFEKAATAGKEMDEHEADVTCKDGSIRHVVFGLSPIHRRNLLILHDITDLNRVKTALREGEERLRSLINSTPDIVCFKDGEGRWIEANDADLELFQLKGVAYRGKKDSELAGFSSFYREAFLTCESTDELAWQKNEPLRGDEIIPRPDGTAKVYDVIKVPLFHPDGRRKGLVVLGRDVTERKKAEDALRESEKRFRAIFEQAAVGVVQVSARTGRFIGTNKRFSDILGYSREEMASKTFLDITHPEDIRMQEEQLEELYEGRIERFSFEKRYIRKDGSIVWVKLTASPMWAPGEEPDYYVAIVEDITEQKRIKEEKLKMEKQLRQAQKMEAIGTLAGGIAHDFNNILGAIMGYTELSRLDTPPSSILRSNLEEVLTAAHRAKDLVKQILAFSRQESEHKRAPVEIGRIVKEALKLLRASLPATIEIRQDIQSETAMVLADSTQIHQVLVNLCTNAGHAMSEGGVLTVGLTDVHWDYGLAALHPELKPASYLKLSVSDTGHGMDAATLERIFDPYFTTKEIGSGSGLGLAVVHGIVKRHDGAISVYSEPGKGSSFQIYFPKIDGGPEDRAEEASQIPTGTERILLVDDEEMLADIGCRMLELLGYSVVTKPGGIEALDLFRTDPGRFDLVITDYTMPHLTGSDLAREIMKIRSDIPVVICTGFSERITAEKARAVGIREFVMKPLGMREIGEVIRRVLDEKKNSCVSDIEVELEIPSKSCTV